MRALAPVRGNQTPEPFVYAGGVILPSPVRYLASEHRDCPRSKAVFRFPGWWATISPLAKPCRT